MSGDHHVPDDKAVFEYLVRLGDDRLVLGHRTSEWCGHAPILEEDIALANIALDLIGEATLLLRLAGEVEGAGRSEDALAFMRDATAYRNTLLVELPNDDYARTIVRLFFFATYSLLLWDKLTASANETLAGIAAKALKESKYHVRHAAEWVIMLGDGTEESHARAQRAVDELWPYTGEMFIADDVDAQMSAQGIGADLAAIESLWLQQVRAVLADATLAVPGDTYMQRGGRRGRHTEHLGHMLAEMQIVPRSYPGAQW